MEKNQDNYLDKVLNNLPKSTIMYTQKPNPMMPIPYVLTARDYKELELDGQKLSDLTPKEQLILLTSSDKDPTYSSKLVLAGIFKARKISERSTNSDDAIAKCNDLLIELNQTTFQKRSSISEVISRNNIHANLLEYYLKVERKCANYDREQQTKTASIKNFVNGILEKITRKPRLGPPYTQDERDRGAREWEQFRAEQNASPDLSNEQVLKRYRYNSDIRTTDKPFHFLFNDPELSALEEEYATNNLALKVLDGSAYKRATSIINRNPRRYLPQKEENKTK